MSIVSNFGRNGLALLLILSNTAGMTPIWLLKGMWLWSKNLKESPNPLQWYLTFHARATLYWLAKLQAQPLPKTHPPSRLSDWLSGRQTVWIEPAAVKTKSVNSIQKGQDYLFDDTELPVSLRKDEMVKPTIGIWYLNPEEKFEHNQLKKVLRRSPVLLYFHGGAFVTLEAGDMSMGFTLARMQAKFGKVDLFTIDYRLAPGSKFPSQLFEAYTAWKHLREMGYEKMFIGGDSAGANLALSLWKYLDEIEKDTTSVAGLILHSPWLDIEGYRRTEYKANLHTCTLTPAYTQIGFKAIQSGNLPNAKDPWISPIWWNDTIIARLPAIIITSGGAEALLEESKIFVRKIRSAGKEVDHIITPEHPHDFGAMIWFYPSIKKVHSAVGSWLRKVNSAL